MCSKGKDMLLPGLNLEFNYDESKFVSLEDFKGVIPTDPKRFNVTCPLLSI